MTADVKAIPDFNDLPSVEGRPQGNTWGFWGPSDEIGTLNLLTPTIVQKASSEIKCGRSVSLDLPLDYFPDRLGDRRAFERNVIDYHAKYGMYVYDDELHFNTQSSSQWDGMTHCATQQDGYYYNGLKHEDVLKKKDGRNGTHRWLERGGIVGRGILLDYPLWREQTHQAQADPGSSHAITVVELEAMIQHFGIALRQGDILLLRTGYSNWYGQASSAERQKILKQEAFIGVEASMKAVKWLWNHHIAAVATDAPGFEVCPVPWSEAASKIIMHEWILVHFGMPLGELWNLEDLSGLCQELQRWSFFFTSAPLHVIGGTASPPNAIAVL